MACSVDNTSMGWFGKPPKAEQRKMHARLLYDFEVECREQDWGFYCRPPCSAG